MTSCNRALAQGLPSRCLKIHLDAPSLNLECDTQYFIFGGFDCIAIFLNLLPKLSSGPTVPCSLLSACKRRICQTGSGSLPWGPAASFKRDEEVQHERVVDPDRHIKYDSNVYRCVLHIYIYVHIQVCMHIHDPRQNGLMCVKQEDSGVHLVCVKFNRSVSQSYYTLKVWCTSCQPHLLP